MPSLAEIKDMLKNAEAEAEKAIGSMFAPEDEKAPAEEPSAPTAAVLEPARAQQMLRELDAEPVFVSEKPYGLVDGIQGVKYQQDGAYFNNLRQFVRKG